MRRPLQWCRGNRSPHPRNLALHASAAKKGGDPEPLCPQTQSGRLPMRPANDRRAQVSTTIVCEVRFEAAHHLPHVPPQHKCRRLHGHSFRCEIHVEGPCDPHTGWVRDFADLRAAFAPLHAVLDHHYLNEVEGLQNPTSEVLARWIWDKMALGLPGLCAIVVHETCSARCIYTGP